MAITDGYTLYHQPFYEGQAIDSQLKNIITRLNKTSAALKFGRGVIADGQNGMKLPSPSVNPNDYNFLGVLYYTLTQKADSTGLTVPEGRDGAILSDGVVAVRVIVDVTHDTPAYLVYGDGTNDNAGLWSNAVGAGPTAAAPISGAKFVTSALAGELACLRLNVGN